jgi:hypothetical protein
MRSHEDGGQSATTQVKVFSPEKAFSHRARSSISLKSESGSSLMVRIY